MSHIDRHIAQIQKFCPTITVHSAYLNEDGQYNYVLVINDEWIFRFARFAESAATLQREVAILGAIQKHITLDIPNPIYQNLESKHVEEIFVGYRMISGTPLWYENFQTISPKKSLIPMAEQLATFLKELHTIAVEDVIPMPLPVEDQQADWADLYQRFQGKLFHHMRVDAQDEVRQRFEHYLHNPTLYHFDPVLRHGDFGGGNVVANLETHNITGIIDFGAAALGDPAIDFGGLSSFDEDFFQHCIRFYPEIEDARERMEFYQSTFALQEALYGVEHNDPEAFEDGIAAYR